MIKKLSDQDLIESYRIALNVDTMAEDFVNRLREELMNRCLLFRAGNLSF